MNAQPCLPPKTLQENQPEKSPATIPAKADEKSRLQKYGEAIALAHFRGFWRECYFKQCKLQRRCKGGPRGSFSKFGKPVCLIERSLEDVPLMAEGQNTPDNETASAC